MISQKTFFNIKPNFYFGTQYKTGWLSVTLTLGLLRKEIFITKFSVDIDRRV